MHNTASTPAPSARRSPRWAAIRALSDRTDAQTVARTLRTMSTPMREAVLAVAAWADRRWASSDWETQRGIPRVLSATSAGLTFGLVAERCTTVYALYRRELADAHPCANGDVRVTLTPLGYAVRAALLES